MERVFQFLAFLFSAFSAASTVKTRRGSLMIRAVGQDSRTLDKIYRISNNRIHGIG
jgi:hypothetical protein